MSKILNNPYLLATLTGGILGVTLGIFSHSSLVLLALFGGWVGLIGAMIAIVEAARSAGKNIHKEKTPGSEQAVKQPLLPKQINSVFLFNTLHNVSALTTVDPQKAAEIVEKLAMLIRAFTEMAKHEYSLLNEEFKYVDLYLAIEKARFGERLEIVRNVAPECLEIKVPNFLLLPIVDNCIRHGVEVYEKPVKIFLTAEMQRDHVIVEISDTGKGIDSGKTAGIMKKGSSLAALNKRLADFYRNRAKINVEALAPSGTRVRLIVPRVFQK